MYKKLPTHVINIMVEIKGGFENKKVVHQIAISIIKN
jgi:hypothetical protein